MLAVTGRVSADNKCEPEMYMFGYAYSFNDSTLYLTSIQKVDNVWVLPHNGFVIERETYSRQLQQYFENDGITDMTCGISYSTKSKKIIKKFNKIKERYKKRVKHMRIAFLSEGDFAFTSIVPMQIENHEEEINKNDAKKAKKEKKAKRKEKAVKAEKSKKSKK